MIKLENRNRVKIVKIRWCMMRKLVDAIYLENIDEVRTILENEPGLIDEKDEHGVLMALLAAKTGNIKLVKYIVEYSRASMNIHDDNNKNMLHYAAMSGDVKTCKYLVECHLYQVI